MSVENALRFIVAVRSDESLKDRIRLVPPEQGLEAVVRIAAEAGFAFSAEDLRAAHRHEWGMRWIRERIRDGAAPDATGVVAPQSNLDE
jgi:predicted ribosomally synthesized peptide with nif11-like leader